MLTHCSVWLFSVSVWKKLVALTKGEQIEQRLRMLWLSRLHLVEPIWTQSSSAHVAERDYARIPKPVSAVVESASRTD